MASGVSLVFAAIFGKKIINFLKYKQVGETVRDLGLQGQKEKSGTPTMGGLIIIATVLVPVMLFCDLQNIYIILLIVTTLWMGLIGFIDDYIKIFRKDKKGLHGRFKVAGQVSLGLIVGLTLYYHEDVLVRDYKIQTDTVTQEEMLESRNYRDIKSTQSTIPFLKNNELDYSSLVPFKELTPVLYVVVVIFIITAVSNGANITDGIDGLAAGTSAIIAATLAVLAYVSGNVIFSKYLGIMYIPNTGEVVVFCTAFVGACIGFLWYNSYPAQVFMGDTGSLVLGAVIAVLALIIRKELLIPVLCGIFLVENLSVILQVSYFKYTKKKYGEGRRIFLMSPLHHHYQKKQIHEAKIVTRFWIFGLLLALATLATLKVR
jgi:phospho-N-acetylmuramoyl-pentapeptide-transferase